MNNVFLGVVFCLAFALPALAASDDEVAARKAALDIAGAFSNDGYKVRDGNWSAPIKKGEAKVVQVNLYAGNAYWFSLGTNEAAQKMAVTIYDESGKVQSSDPYEDGPKTAAGFSPPASGPYYIKVEEMDGEPANFCLIYSYK
ncbi:MAG: hypothetical protein M3O82_06385 [Verrucomicrobiota bacterium]|nr:hypothetical protein [Verrucomicrobiota bacterium]